ncbi:hypothetical protein VmeM32_00178 [Vibrio phage vB_VmeM-32]|nr:hypothetical protein VmeM32_00178 [Vibrio phage vB_VmeM-32]
MENAIFKANVQKHKQFRLMLKNYGLSPEDGVIFDDTLNIHMNGFVCYYDLSQFEANTVFTLDMFPEIEEYVNVGRECKIAAYEKEKLEIAAFFANS